MHAYLKMTHACSRKHPSRLADVTFEDGGNPLHPRGKEERWNSDYWSRMNGRTRHHFTHRVETSNFQQILCWCRTRCRLSHKITSFCLRATANQTTLDPHAPLLIWPRSMLVLIWHKDERAALCDSLLCQSEWVCGRSGWTWFSLWSGERERKRGEAHTIWKEYRQNILTAEAMQLPSNVIANWGRGSDLNMTLFTLLIVTGTQKHTQVCDPSKSGTRHHHHQPLSPFRNNLFSEKIWTTECGKMPRLFF